MDCLDVLYGYLQKVGFNFKCTSVCYDEATTSHIKLRMFFNLKTSLFKKSNVFPHSLGKHAEVSFITSPSCTG